MRTILILAGLAVAVVAGALVMIPLVVSEDAIRAQIAQQVSAWTGREVAVGGEPKLSFFPEPRVTLKNLSIAGPSFMPGSAVMTTESLSGTVRLLPLLIGEVEIETFDLQRPTIHLVRDEDGRRNWIFDSGAAALQLAFAGDVPLGRFRFRDGTIIVEDRANGETQRLEKVNLKADWPSVRHPFSVRATAEWRDEPVRLDVTMASPFDYISGDTTGAQAVLSAEPVRIAFDGSASDVKRPRLAGSFTIEAPSLRGLLGWLGNGAGAGPALGELRLAGNARYENRQFTLEQASVTLDGNKGDGGLRIGLSSRPVVEGTLAYDRLDLTPYAAVISDNLEAPNRPWSAIRVDASWLDDFAADLRLSARTIGIGPMLLTDVAASVLVKNDAMEIGLARADFYGGTLSGALSLVEARADAGVNLSARLHGEDFRLHDALAAGVSQTKVAGMATMAVDLETAGATAGELVAGMTGTLSAQVADGVMPGVDLAAVAAAIDRGDPAPPAAGQGAGTDYTLLDAALLFGGHAALLQRAVLEGNGFASRLAGTISLDDGVISLSAYMATESGGEQETPFEIIGTVAEPEVIFNRTN